MVPRVIQKSEWMTSFKRQVWPMKHRSELCQKDGRIQTVYAPNSFSSLKSCHNIDAPCRSSNEIWSDWRKRLSEELGSISAEIRK